MDKTNYSTNLTEKQYEVIKNSLETKIRRRKQSLKEIINAMFYPVNTGCQWRLFPNDFPNQSIKTTSVRWEKIGFDGNKKVKGRKRHIITDTDGLPLPIVVYAANKHDSKTAFEVIEPLKYRFERMKKYMQMEAIEENLLEM
ncbi:MAG: transposase [Prevotellaceae bacterium]|jgi:putative transposase|nr:transposase [Prevotellaceae bacterium]